MQSHEALCTLANPRPGSKDVACGSFLCGRIETHVPLGLMQTAELSSHDRCCKRPVPSAKDWERAASDDRHWLHLFRIPLPNTGHRWYDRWLAMREWFPEAVERIRRSVAPSSTRHIGEVFIRTSGVCCRRMKHDPLLSNCNQHCQGHETCIEPEPAAKHVILQ